MRPSSNKPAVCVVEGTAMMEEYTVVGFVVGHKMAQFSFVTQNDWAGAGGGRCVTDHTLLADSLSMLDLILLKGMGAS